MKLKYIALLFSTAFLMLVVACGGAAEPEVDIEATVEARVQAVLEATALSVPHGNPHSYGDTDAYTTTCYSHANANIYVHSYADTYTFPDLNGRAD